MSPSKTVEQEFLTSVMHIVTERVRRLGLAG